MNIERSISEEENYANYLLLPLIGLSKFSYGESRNLVNAYITENGKIAVVVHNKYFGIDFWEHPDYLTDVDFEEGTLILYRCPIEFEPDLIKFRSSDFAGFSEKAKSLIYALAGLHKDFPRKGKAPFTSRLVRVLRGELQEPPITEQDVLYDVDTDYTPTPGSEAE